MPVSDRRCRRVSSLHRRSRRSQRRRVSPVPRRRPVTRRRPPGAARAAVWRTTVTRPNRNRAAIASSSASMSAVSSFNAGGTTVQVSTVGDKPQRVSGDGKTPEGRQHLQGDRLVDAPRRRVAERTVDCRLGIRAGQPDCATRRRQSRTYPRPGRSRPARRGRRSGAWCPRDPRPHRQQGGVPKSAPGRTHPARAQHRAPWRSAGRARQSTGSVSRPASRNTTAPVTATLNAA